MGWSRVAVAKSCETVERAIWAMCTWVGAKLGGSVGGIVGAMVVLEEAVGATVTEMVGVMVVVVPGGGLWLCGMARDESSLFVLLLLLLLLLPKKAGMITNSKKTNTGTVKAMAMRKPHLDEHNPGGGKM